jgi:cobyrinic acid a,c-diamide synthase
MLHPRTHSKPSGFVLGGLHGSSGKTAVTCLIAAGLEARGNVVQPFKAGPDYIDPSYHNRFCTRASRNLDAWLMGKDSVLREAIEHTRSATGILEGVMGLFDGAFPTSEEGSTMELARWLEWPIVLCIPAAKAGRSIAATLRGFLEEARPTPIMGVILNGVSGNSHAEYLREAISPMGIPVLGAIPNTELLRWEERHLGLQAAQESTLPSADDLADLAERTLDLNALSSLVETHRRQNIPELVPQRASIPKKRVAIAQDAAFHFYYQANLEWIENHGGELVPFSPLQSLSLPSDIDAIVLGGGFPEVYAEQLSENNGLRTDLQAAVESGIPCYAECGGLMLLTHELVTLNGSRFPMCGVIPGSVSMTRSLQHFGYCQTDGSHRGHEFHHSCWERESTHANAWTVARRRNGVARLEGFRTHSLHASYVHLYFPQNSRFIGTQLGLLS